MATRGADPSRAGQGRTHFTRTRWDALPLLGAPHRHPFSPEWGWGRGHTRSGERSPCWSAAAHKALHLLAFQAPPWAALFRGSRMPPSVVGGTVRLPLAALPPPSHLSLLLPAARHRPQRDLHPGRGGPRERPCAPRESAQRCSLRSTTSPGRSAAGSGAHAHPRSGRIGSRAAGEPGRRHAPT